MGTSATLLCAAFLMVGDPEPQPHFGCLNQPAFSIDKKPRLPMTLYEPQAGDVLLYSDANVVWGMLYAIALTSAPGHSGLVVRLDDGEMAVLEAGYNDKPWVRVVPLAERLQQYPGTIWVRQRRTPISEEQSRIITCFAQTIDGHRYGVIRLLGQMTPFRARGPVRTHFLGKPVGIRNTYICSEAVLEALAAAGLTDAEATRPTATYPRDLFFERGTNIYVNRHPPLAADWEVPALWRRTP